MFRLGKRDSFQTKIKIFFAECTDKESTFNANIIKKNIQNPILDSEPIFDQQVA